MKLKPLQGKKFGKWLVKEYIGNSYWLCICDCGKEKNVRSGHLRSGKSTSCGKCGIPKKDLTDKKFGRWLVIKFAYMYRRNSFWFCICECGNKKTVRGERLISGKSTSCGCYNKEAQRTKNNGYKVGHIPYNKGKGNITENQKARQSGKYKIWEKSVKERDNNTCQEYYVKGGNGITVVAHHIFPLWWCLEQNREDLIYDINNGITLRQDFHWKIKGKELKYIKYFQDKL